MSVHKPQMRVFLTAGRNGSRALFSTGGYCDLHGALPECLMLEKHVQNLARRSEHTFVAFGLPESAQPRCA